MKIIIDYLCVSFKYDNVGNLMEELNLTQIPGRPLRSIYYSYGDNYDGVKIFYNMDENYNVTETYLDISGKGCRFIETLNPDFDWFRFLYSYNDKICDKTVHISRLDIACDITDGSITMKTIHRYAHNEMYICRSKCKSLGMVDAEECRYFGSKNSDRRLRIYDKAMQMGIPDTDWLRFELQMRNDNATSFYLNWCQQRDIGKLYAGVMLDYIRFVQIPKGMNKKDFLMMKDQNNRSRLKIAPWYNDFLCDAERISQLYLAGEEYTLGKLERYLEKQSYSSLKTYIEAHDGDITKLLDGIKHAKQNVHQRLLLAQLHIDKDKKLQTEEDILNQI